MSEVSKRNHIISYLKGVAIICIILVHLINWSNIGVNSILYYLRDFIHFGIFFFITLSGSLIVLAYLKYDNLLKPTKKLLNRAVILLFIYFLYSVIKFYIYDFSKELFYEYIFISKGKWTIQHLLGLKSFTVPITVLLLWSQFLIITPLILLIIKKIKYKHVFTLSLIGFFITINYIYPLPKNLVTNIIYGKGYILFSFGEWFLPYLIGLYLGMLGFNKHKGKILIFFTITSIIFAINQYLSGASFELGKNMYPLKPYYISLCFFIMYILIYIFEYFEKKKTKIIGSILSTLRFMGDNTLIIYVVHWIIIDLTVLIINPVWIWLTISLQIIIHLYLKKEIIKKNYKEFISEIKE